MKPLNIAYYVVVAVFVAFFSVSMYGEFFGKPSGYVFEEFDHKCIAVEDGRKMAMWCVPIEEKSE